MPQRKPSHGMHIGELARRVGASTDTIRYYERLGLLGAPARTESGYRCYGETELGRLQFIRHAKRLGFSLDEIRGLLGLADEGACQPLRRQVADLLRQRLVECDARMIELATLKANLEERYELALARQEEPACRCAAFPATCACLPAPSLEVQ